MPYNEDAELRKNASGCSDPTAYEALKNIEREERENKMEDHCVCCGRIIPEGIQVCPNCQAKSTNTYDDKFHKLLHNVY